jgi:hypothetical protein
MDQDSSGRGRKSCFMAKLMVYYVHINRKNKVKKHSEKKKRIAMENPVESFSFDSQLRFLFCSLVINCD